MMRMMNNLLKNSSIYERESHQSNMSKSLLSNSQFPLSSFVPSMFSNISNLIEESHIEDLYA